MWKQLVKNVARIDRPMRNLKRPLRSVSGFLSLSEENFKARQTTWSRTLSSTPGDKSDKSRIRESFAESTESPAHRRLTLDAKLRMLRFLDKVYDSNKDADMHDMFSKYARFESNRTVDFHEFLLADKDGDGRITSAEWEKFLQKKALHEAGLEYDQPNAINVEIPLSTNQVHAIAQEQEGLHVSINGMRYRLTLVPEGKTAAVIDEKKKRLHETLTQLAKMEVEKRPLDAKAARHTKRVLTVALFYLLSQAGVIAKLTFFSRFGWDVMEPITYFITFGTAIMGFMFFQYHKIEYSYPALAALLTQRKAKRLYKAYAFDIDHYGQLQALALKYERQLLVLEPPQTMLPPEDYQVLEQDLRESRRQQLEQQLGQQLQQQSMDPSQQQNFFQEQGPLDRDPTEPFTQKLQNKDGR